MVMTKFQTIVAELVADLIAAFTKARDAIEDSTKRELGDELSAATSMSSQLAEVIEWLSTHRSGVFLRLTDKGRQEQGCYYMHYHSYTAVELPTRPEQQEAVIDDPDTGEERVLETFEDIRNGR